MQLTFLGDLVHYIAQHKYLLTDPITLGGLFGTACVALDDPFVIKRAFFAVCYKVAADPLTCQIPIRSGCDWYPRIENFDRQGFSIEPSTDFGP